MGQKRMNLLLVFADQMRGQDLGAAGNPQVMTPNLDRLAREGVFFSNAVANCPVCTPSRGSLLTGLSPLAHRAVTNDLPVRTDIPSLGTALRAAGYRTGYVGKWHLDGLPRDKFTPPGPRRLGFDDYWAVWNCAHDYFDGRYFLDTEEVHRFEGYEPDGQTDLAIGFLERHRREPFALVLSYGPPHAPYEQVPDEFLKLYEPRRLELRPNVIDRAAGRQERWRRTLARYYAAITALDADLGRLLGALERLGLSDRTLVVFTSDHGDMLGSQGRRKKEQPWEESIRVPLLMRAPGALPAGRRFAAPTGIMDLAPTLLGLLGVDVPDSMQGLDLSALLRGGGGEPPRSVPIGIYIPVDQAVEQGVPEWRGIRTGRYTYARFGSGEPWVLYDNVADPYQLRNLAAEPSAAALRADLDAELEGWLERLDDPFLPWQETVRRLGMVEIWNERERRMHPDAPRLVE